MSPTQSPNQKRRYNLDGGREEEPHERGTDPPLSGNGLPSIVAITAMGASDCITEWPFNKE